MEQKREETAFLSVVIPAFNEEKIIGGLINELREVLVSFPKKEIIVINDASTDSTGEILMTFASKHPDVKVLHNEQNQGHGPSLARAFRETKGDYVFHMDGDRQFFPSDFSQLWEAMNRYHFDLVIGIRTKRKDSAARIVLSKLLHLLLRLVFGLRAPDSNSPFRLFRRSALDTVLPYLPARPLIPSILMLVAASKLQLKIGWIPVTHLPRKAGKSFLKSWKIFLLCVPAAKELITFRKITS